MKFLIKNPLSLWLVKLIRSKILEYKYKEKNLKIGYLSVTNNCSFGEHNTIYNHVSMNEVQLSDYTYVANGTTISKTTIGKFCSIGPDCKIGLGKHPTKDFVSTHPIFFSTLKQAQITFAEKNYFEEFENIEIGNDVWMGANVIVVDGIKIGDGAIIAAGSVVTKDILAYAIVGGVPAKTIRYRFEKEEIEKLLELRWWNKDMDYLRDNFMKFHDVKKFLNE
jgi:acetyltransferase-like isoleucine patch superfamily enzyme